MKFQFKIDNLRCILKILVGPFMKIGRHLLGRLAEIGQKRTGVGG